MKQTIYIWFTGMLCLVIHTQGIIEHTKNKRGATGIGGYDYGSGGAVAAGHGYASGEAGYDTGGVGEGSHLVAGGYGNLGSYGAVSSIGGGEISVGLGSEEESSVGATIITRKIPITVPRPYIVEVEKKVPYIVKVPIEIPVPKPYEVPVPRPYHVEVERKVPVTIEKPVPYTVKVPVNVNVPQAVPVSVPKPFVVEVPKAVKVPVAKPVIVPKAVPIYVDHHHHGSSGVDIQAGVEDYGHHQ